VSQTAYSSGTQDDQAATSVTVRNVTPLRGLLRGLIVYLTRRYRFAAAHRLHSPVLSPEENARVYGKCNNPYGHVHNYILEVTVAGEVDLATGMVYDLAILDRKSVV